ncbi:MAG: 50S ribosomal protein L18 [Parcubacteria group bacterium]|nr:50S ribosomal protein L18 [Parcubacteria group bacterium]
MTRHDISPRIIRKRRFRHKVLGTAEIPRLSVFRSLKYLSAQCIDDASGTTLIAVYERELSKAERTLSKTERAVKLAVHLAAKAKARGVTRIRFDRAGSAYHGRVKAFAEQLRVEGLVF